MPEPERVVKTGLKIARRVELPARTEVILPCKLTHASSWLQRTAAVAQPCSNHWRYAEDGIVIVEQNGVKFKTGLVGDSSTHIEYLWACIIQSFGGGGGNSVHLRFSANTISKETLLLQIAPKIYQTSDELSSQWSSQNYVWDFFKF